MYFSNSFYVSFTSTTCFTSGISTGGSGIGVGVGGLVYFLLFEDFIGGSFVVAYFLTKLSIIPFNPFLLPILLSGVILKLPYLLPLSFFYKVLANDLFIKSLAKLLEGVVLDVKESSCLEDPFLIPLVN
jgi:hypothetical protein